MVPIPHLAGPSHGECWIQTGDGIEHPTFCFLLLQVADSCIGNVRQSPVAEDFDQGLVINSDVQVCASEDKVSASLECLSDSECLPLDGSEPAFFCMGETASYKSDPPAVLAAEEFTLGAGAMALKHPTADAGL